MADSGDLLLTTALGDVRVQKPIVYQLEKDGHKTLVAGNYVASPKAPTQVGIQLATYDTSRPLVIDPTLFYSTYLGGSGYDEGVGIAVDASGNAYVTGYTFSSNFPTTAGAFQPTYGGGSSYDTFITKLNPTGSALVYSTYLGGSIGDHGRGIAVDAAGNAYVMGDTNSANFPITAGAFQPTYGGSDDGFITALNPTGSALVYSSYLGGSGSEFVRSIAVDAAGNAYVTGYTSSTNFPTTAGAFQPSRGAANNVFVTKVNPTGSALVYSTYLGGSSDSYGYGIAVDASGSAYVTGEALLNFPTTTGAFQSTYGG
ncbi:MAG: SBBP repeat-containing protein, partial [Gammaproteobacteria bacterium]|nr:SBBP repeat-containing protein [Gammaproteobacteria bacterium]